MCEGRSCHSLGRTPNHLTLSTTSTLSAGSTGSQARLIQSSQQPENYQPTMVKDLGNNNNISLSKYLKRDNIIYISLLAWKAVNTSRVGIFLATAVVWGFEINSIQQLWEMKLDPLVDMDEIICFPHRVVLILSGVFLWGIRFPKPLSHFVRL